MNSQNLLNEEPSGFISQLSNDQKASIVMNLLAVVKSKVTDFSTLTSKTLT